MDQSNGASTSQGSHRRTWLIGAVIVAILMAITAVAVTLTANREDATYADGSPEAALQAYAEAWQAGEADRAYQMLTPAVQARVPVYEFRGALAWEEHAPVRVWIEERTDHADRVSLVLSVETTYGGLLGPDRDTHTLRVSLIEMDGAWRIDSPLVGFYHW